MHRKTGLQCSAQFTEIGFLLKKKNFFKCSTLQFEMESNHGHPNRSFNVSLLSIIGTKRLN